MLTDYHLHLRPDEPEASADATSPRRTSIATSRPPRRRGSRSSGSPSTSTASPRRSRSGTTRSGARTARDDLDAYCEFVRTTPLRLGIEMDFVAGARGPDRRRCSTRHDFDYVVGSVHFVGDARGRHPTSGTSGSRDRRPRPGLAPLLRPLAEAVRTGLFDILAHPDLVKVWGEGRPRPQRDPRFYYEPAVEAIAESGIAVEVSTAGLRKPVGELYPGGRLRRDVRRRRRRVRALLRRPPARAGRLRLRSGAWSSMRGWGVDRAGVFERRERDGLEPLG